MKIVIVLTIFLILRAKVSNLTWSHSNWFRRIFHQIFFSLQIKCLVTFYSIKVLHKFFMTWETWYRIRNFKFLSISKKVRQIQQKGKKRLWHWIEPWKLYSENHKIDSESVSFLREFSFCRIYLGIFEFIIIFLLYLHIAFIQRTLKVLFSKE